MFLVRVESVTAVVPGFLLGYRGEAMMPEHSRYMKTLPFFIAANSVACAMSAYALALQSSHSVLRAYGLFMAIFSARMLTQRLIRVKFHGLREPASQAALSVRFNACLVAATLALMGVGFLSMNDEFDAVFEVFGVLMIGLAAAWLFALRRSGRG